MKHSRFLMVLVVLLAIVMTACGGDDDDQATNTPDTPADTSIETPDETEEMAEETEEMAEETEEMASGESLTIEIQDNSFGDDPVTVSVGTTVTWTNEGSSAHTVTSTDGLFASDSLISGGSFTFTFSEAGTFDYYCQFHGTEEGSGMAGTIIVEEA